MAPSLSELTQTFGRIGILSFGGPAAQIALMHRVLVEEKQWINDRDFVSALSFCMLLPGPEAMQLATWSGWRMHGTLGGLIAGLLFVLPGALVVLTLSAIYAAFGSVPLMAAVFLGIQAVVIALVIEALTRISKKALPSTSAKVIAVFAFAGLFFFNLPFPIIILAAGLWGYATATAGGVVSSVQAVTRPDPRQTFRTLMIWGMVWLLPLFFLWLDGGLLFQIGLFFSKLAVVTFGGAYAVLAWMTQEVVEVRGWLTAAQMMAGLGLAETTPGPLILVTQFVGFMAGFGQGGWGLAMLGALVALWMTFAPCFLWIFLGAPYLYWITSAPRLSGALSAIMAAVVGVIANLALWFAAHFLFTEVGQLSLGPLTVLQPDLATIELVAAALSLGSGILLLGLHQPLWRVLCVSALVSALVSAI